MAKKLRGGQIATEHGPEMAWQGGGGMKLDSESAPNAFFHPFGGNNDEWYLSKKFHDPKPTPKDRPNPYFCMKNH